MKRRLIYGLVIAVLAAESRHWRLTFIWVRRRRRKRRTRWIRAWSLFADVLEKVRTEYVDGTNLTYHDLIYDALKGMIN